MRNLRDFNSNVWAEGLSSGVWGPQPPTSKKGRNAPKPEGFFPDPDIRVLTCKSTKSQKPIKHNNQNNKPSNTRLTDHIHHQLKKFNRFITYGNNKSAEKFNRFKAYGNNKSAENNNRFKASGNNKSTNNV